MQIAIKIQLQWGEAYFEQRHLGCNAHLGSFICFHISWKNKDTNHHVTKIYKTNRCDKDPTIDHLIL